MREGEGEIEGEKRERWENREKRGKGDEQHKAVGKRETKVQGGRANRESNRERREKREKTERKKKRATTRKTRRAAPAARSPVSPAALSDD